MWKDGLSYLTVEIRGATLITVLSLI